MSDTQSPDSDDFDWVEVTAHAAKRWQQRRGAFGTVAELAWNEAEPLGDCEAIHSDLARYHARSDTILLANLDAGDPTPHLVTVLPGSDHDNAAVRDAVDEVTSR